LFLSLFLSFPSLFLWFALSFSQLILRVTQTTSQESLTVPTIPKATCPRAIYIEGLMPLLL
jgi:hypothetical protein